jgi:hypothetical protein
VNSLKQAAANKFNDLKGQAAAGAEGLVAGLVGMSC